MSKTRKTLIALFSLLFVFSIGLFTLTACGGSKTPDSITVDTKGMKTTYVVGETLDATGIKVTAKYKGKDDVVLKDGDFTIENASAPLTVKSDFMETEFKSTQSFTVTYKGKTKNFGVTVTNYITEATVKNLPTKLAYSLGQKFNPAGMVVAAKFQDNQTRDIEVTRTNSTTNPDTAMRKSMEGNFKVVLGGQEIPVAITVENVLYVEAETGYRNGELIEQSTGDQGNLRKDAMTENAQKGASDFYKAQLKADFAWKQIDDAKKAELTTPPAEDAEEGAEGTFDQTAYDAWVVEMNKPATAAELKTLFKGTDVYLNDVKAGGEAITKKYVAIVTWIDNAANKEALDAYVNGAEFTEAVETYLASEAYTDRVKELTAHDSGDGDEYYLGQNNQGDTISFVFAADAAGKAELSFRMSSAYLYVGGVHVGASNWNSVIMGDVDFNTLCEFYVNGVKQEIEEGTILPGGKSPDGSVNQSLWTNWQDVTFEHVDLVKGRNVIELKIKQHGIKAQENYSFAANVDTMKVTPDKKPESTEDTCNLDLYDDQEVNIEVVATELKFVNNEGVANVVIKGTYTSDNVIEGYINDVIDSLFDIKVGNALAAIEVGDENTFTATVDVSKLAFDTHSITAKGELLDVTDLEIDQEVVSVVRAGAQVAKDDYKLVVTTTTEGEDEEAVSTSTVALDKSTKYQLADASFALPEENANEKIHLVLGTGDDEGKVFINIEGSFDGTIEGYDLEKEGDLAEVQAYLAGVIDDYFFFDMTNRAGWAPVLQDVPLTYTVDAKNKTFILSFEVTECPIVDKSVAYIHMAPENKRDPNSNNWWDYKPNCAAFSSSVILEKGEKSLKYTLAYKEGVGMGSGDYEAYGLVYLAVETYDVNKVDVKLTGATLAKVGEAETERPALVIAGTLVDFEGKTLTDNEKIEANKNKLEGALEYEAIVGFTTWAAIGEKGNATVAWNGAEFTLTLVIDSTSSNIAAGIKIVFHKNFAFLGDTAINDNNLTPAVVTPTIGSTVTVGDFVYTIYDHSTMPDQDGGWQKNFVIIEVTAKAE